MNLDGGIHEVPLPNVAGRLWLCGKHAIAPDPIGILEEVTADHVICLVERFELEDRYPHYVEWLTTSGAATWFPIADLDFVSVDEARECLAAIFLRLSKGESIIAHCAAGIGRAGTLAVCLCMSSGMSLEESLRHVRLRRPGAGPEVGRQMDFVVAWAEEMSLGHS